MESNKIRSSNAIMWKIPIIRSKLLLCKSQGSSSKRTPDFPKPHDITQVRRDHNPKAIA